MHVVAEQKLVKGYPSCYIQVSSMNLVDSLDVFRLE